MRRNFLTGLAGVLATTALGCYPRGENAFPSTTTANRQMDESRRQFARHHAQMSDNAMLHDMSIVDDHFVPHTTELNGTGAARLERMAVLLSAYGGTVRYDARVEDADLIAERIAHIQEYLEVSGCDMSRVKVESMLTGGHGDRAVRSIANDDRGPVAGNRNAPAAPLPLFPSGNPSGN